MGCRCAGDPGQRVRVSTEAVVGGEAQAGQREVLGQSIFSTNWHSDQRHPGAADDNALEHPSSRSSPRTPSFIISATATLAATSTMAWSDSFTSSAGSAV